MAARSVLSAPTVSQGRRSGPSQEGEVNFELQALNLGDGWLRDCLCLPVPIAVFRTPTFETIRLASSRRRASRNRARPTGTFPSGDVKLGAGRSAALDDAGALPVVGDGVLQGPSGTAGRPARSSDAVMVRISLWAIVTSSRPRRLRVGDPSDKRSRCGGRSSVERGQNVLARWGLGAQTAGFPACVPLQWRSGRGSGRALLTPAKGPNKAELVRGMMKRLARGMYVRNVALRRDSLQRGHRGLHFGCVSGQPPTRRIASYNQRGDERRGRGPNHRSREDSAVRRGDVRRQAGRWKGPKFWRAARPSRWNLGERNPAQAAVMQVASVPARFDFIPSPTISARRSAPSHPCRRSVMPRLPKLAKPHIA
jgi:hypothetical protein